MRELLRELLAVVKENNTLAKDNNRMLRVITEYLATEAAHAESENIHDFGRNVIANLVSNTLKGNNFGRR